MHAALGKLVSLAWLFVMLSVSVHAQAGPAAAGQHTLTGGAPLRHGTLLLSTITVLDKPVATAASHSMQLTSAPDADATWRCCLSVKAYTAAVQPGSSSHSAAQQAHASTSANFSICRNSTSNSCTNALLADTASSHSSLYKVALLLPAQAEQHSSPVPATAPAQTAGSPRAQQDTGDNSDTSSDRDHVTASDQPADAPSKAHLSAFPAQQASTSAQRSALHDMLLTVHAEQEIAGQVYLVILTQLVRAGAGVVKVSLNMSHFSHTWTSPDALPAAKSVGGPLASSSSTVSDPQQTPQAQSDALPEQLPAVNSTDTASTDSTGAPQAWPSHCPPMPAQDTQEAATTMPPAQAVPLTAPVSAHFLPAFLPSKLRTQLMTDPPVLAVYLQTVLGIMPPSNASPTQPQQQQQAAHTAMQGHLCAAGVSSHGSSGCGRCAALPDETDSAATAAWVAELQAVLLTCAWDHSLPSYLQAAAAVRPPPMPPAASQLDLFLTSVASVPAVAAVLDAVLASDVPVLSKATREQVLLGLMATAAVLLLLLIKLCRSAGKTRQQTCPAQAQQQQQQLGDAHRAQANTAAAQDACPAQQQDQNAVTLEEHVQDMDDDPFGYGPPPAAFPARIALDVGQPGPAGSMLAAAHALRRASAMAAGEAAGALKDAFMRRHTNQVQQGHLTAAGGYAVGSTAAGTGRYAPAAGAAAAERDWLNEDDEDRVNQAPESIQRQLQAGGRWQRDAEGRLVRGSWKAVRNSLSAAAQAVLSAVGSGGKAVAAAGGFGRGSAAAAAGGAAVVHAADERFEGGEAAEDALALQQLLSAAPGAVVSFSGK